MHGVCLPTLTHDTTIQPNLGKPMTYRVHGVCNACTCCMYVPCTTVCTLHDKYIFSNKCSSNNIINKYANNTIEIHCKINEVTPHIYIYTGIKLCIKSYLSILYIYVRVWYNTWLYYINFACVKSYGTHHMSYRIYVTTYDDTSFKCMNIYMYVHVCNVM